ncbi:MAG: RpoL/Rpb11 RNA polymerase subunit family protein [Candidatus Bilamarchaeaceae archaeon]
MAVKFLVKEKNHIEMEITDIDASLIYYLVEKLNSKNGVEFAATKREHPLIGGQKIIVKTKGVSAADVTIKALEEIEEETDEFKKKFQQLIK